MPESKNKATTNHRKQQDRLIAVANRIPLAAIRGISSRSSVRLMTNPLKPIGSPHPQPQPNRKSLHVSECVGLFALFAETKCLFVKSFA